MSNAAVIHEIKTIWNPLASKPAPHVTGEGDGVSESPSQTPHPSPLAGDIHCGTSLPTGESWPDDELAVMDDEKSVGEIIGEMTLEEHGREVFTADEKARIAAARDGQYADPEPFYSCPCAAIKNREPSQSTCPECHRPLNLKWNGDPKTPCRYDPNMHLDILADQAVNLLTRMRTIVDEYRPYVKLADLMDCLQRLDEHRRISLHGLAETPLVMRVAPANSRCVTEGT
jgi:hypothetical protein